MAGETYEFTKIKPGKVPVVEFYRDNSRKDEVIVQIGRHTETFKLDDVVKILNELNCVDDFGGRIRLDLVQTKVLPFVNELVKLTQKAKTI